MFVDVGVFVRSGVFFNPCGEMTGGFANITGITSCTKKFINHKGFEITGNWVFETKNVLNFV